MNPSTFSFSPPKKPALTVRFPILLSLRRQPVYHIVDHHLLPCVLLKSLLISRQTVHHQRSHNLERSVALSVPVTTSPFIASSSSFYSRYVTHNINPCFRNVLLTCSFFLTPRQIKIPCYVLLRSLFILSIVHNESMAFSSYSPSACPIHCSPLSLFTLIFKAMYTSKTHGIVQATDFPTNLLPSSPLFLRDCREMWCTYIFSSHLQPENDCYTVGPSNFPVVCPSLRTCAPHLNILLPYVLSIFVPGQRMCREKHDICVSSTPLRSYTFCYLQTMASAHIH